MDKYNIDTKLIRMTKTQQKLLKLKLETKIVFIILISMTISIKIEIFIIYSGRSLVTVTPKNGLIQKEQRVKHFSTARLELPCCISGLRSYHLLNFKTLKCIGFISI